MRKLSALLVLITSALPLVAQPPATPRDELLRLVSPDTAICLVVQNVRERSRTVAASPLAAWVSEKYQPVLGAAPELQKLKDVETLFTTFLGVSLTDLRDDIFGDAIVLTYTPGPVGKPEAEQGCVMVKARDPEKLAKLIAQLNTVQKTTKELVAVHPMAHRGQGYFQREKSDKRNEFYLLDKGLFVFAGQEASIRLAIEQGLNTRLEPPPVAKSIERLGVQNAFITCWFNPRKLDDAVTAHVAAAGSASEKAARRQFADVWSALDNFALYLDAEKDLELGFSAAYRADVLPAEFKTVLGSRTKSSALWQVIPDDAILALAGRATGRQIVDVLLAFTPPEDRPAVRLEIEKAVGGIIGKANGPAMLQGVGPDWGVWVTPPGKSAWSPGITAAVRVEGNPNAVAKTVGFYTQLAQFGYNRDHNNPIESNTTRQANGSDLTTFTNESIFPAGFQPSYSLTEGHLVVSSSPNLVEAFRKPVGPNPAEDALVLRVSGTALQTYLGAHGREVAKWLADQQGRGVEDVKKEVGTLAEVLTVLDRGEFHVRGDGQVIHGAVRLKFVKPLAK